MAYLCIETAANPFENLAAEELLLDHAAQTGRPVLYLWQNDHTVVIGRNQNPWCECRVALLEAEGGHLARRKTGGGAVYHDSGNLNFSFAMPKALYDETAQYALLQRALAMFGVKAEKTGRNDLTVDGAKFSGNAFLHKEGASLHHGTLLVAGDPARIARYLTPSASKLKSKGVASVASRVAFLQNICPSVTVDRLRGALADAFSGRFGAVETIAPPEREALAAEYAAWDFRFGKTPPFDDEISVLTEKGTLTLAVSLQNGRVVQSKAYADWLDTETPRQMAAVLIRAPYTPQRIESALASFDAAAAAAVGRALREKGEV